MNITPLTPNYPAGLFLLAEVETEIFMIPADNLITVAITRMWNEDVSVMDIAREIRSQGKDDEQFMADAVGQSLYNKIKQLCR